MRRDLILYVKCIDDDVQHPTTIRIVYFYIITSLFIYLFIMLLSFSYVFFFFLIFGRRKLFEKESFLFLPPWYFLLIFGRTAPFSPALKCNRKKIKAEN